jgi:hypothetical protein
MLVVCSNEQGVRTPRTLLSCMPQAGTFAHLAQGNGNRLMSVLPRIGVRALTTHPSGRLRRRLIPALGAHVRSSAAFNHFVSIPLEALCLVHGWTSGLGSPHLSCAFRNGVCIGWTARALAMGSHVRWRRKEFTPSDLLFCVFAAGSCMAIYRASRLGT